MKQKNEISRIQDSRIKKLILCKRKVKFEISNQNFWEQKQNWEEWRQLSYWFIGIWRQDNNSKLDEFWAISLCLQTRISLRGNSSNCLLKWDLEHQRPAKSAWNLDCCPLLTLCSNPSLFSTSAPSHTLEHSIFEYLKMPWNAPLILTKSW